MRLAGAGVTILLGSNLNISSIQGTIGRNATNGESGSGGSDGDPASWGYLRSSPDESSPGVGSPPPPLASSVYRGLSCPLEDPDRSSSALLMSDYFSDPQYVKRAGGAAEARESFVARADAASSLSAEYKASQRVRAAIDQDFAGRRVVLVGDEFLGQAFGSLACLAGDALDAWAAPWKAGAEGDEPKIGKRVDGRIRLSVGGAEVFYSPLAGGIMRYDWEGPQYGDEAPPVSPLRQEGVQPWVEACESRKLFDIIAYAYGPEGSVGDPRKITLGEKDSIFLNAGTHSTRETNQDGIGRLLSCMSEAQLADEANSAWPAVHYVMTSLGHKISSRECGVENFDIPHQREDIELYGGREENIVAVRLDLRKMGNLHVGGPSVDCKTWLQPGVPDLIAAEVAERVVANGKMERIFRTDVDVQGREGSAQIQGGGKDAEDQPGNVVMQKQQQDDMPKGGAQLQLQDLTLAQHDQQQDEVPEIEAQLQQQDPTRPQQDLQQPQQEEEEEEPQSQRPAPEDHWQLTRPVTEDPSMQDELFSDTDGGGSGGKWRLNLPSPKELRETCPFEPDEHTGLEFTPQEARESQIGFDRGLMDGLVEIMMIGNVNNGEVSGGERTSVVDLMASAGQMFVALDRWGIDVNYLGLDWARNVMDVVGQSLPIGGDEEYVVPAICWADPSRPFDLEKKFDLAIAISGAGQHVPPEGEQSFLDNLVRASGDIVVVAWRTKLNLIGEMKVRGANYDQKATERLRDLSKWGFLKGHVMVFRLTPTSKPMFDNV